jgi:hypothetical protein
MVPTTIPNTLAHSLISSLMSKQDDGDAGMKSASLLRVKEQSESKNQSNG